MNENAPNKYTTPNQSNPALSGFSQRIKESETRTLLEIVGATLRGTSLPNYYIP